MSVCCAINYVFVGVLSVSRWWSHHWRHFRHCHCRCHRHSMEQFIKIHSGSRPNNKFTRGSSRHNGWTCFGRRSTQMFNNVSISFGIEISCVACTVAHTYTDRILAVVGVKVVEISRYIKISLKWITKQTRIDSANANAMANVWRREGG